MDFAKRSPEKALLSALAAGYLLRFLPIARIIGLVLSLVRLLWKPAALVFGGRKLWEQFQASSAIPSSANLLKK